MVFVSIIMQFIFLLVPLAISGVIIYFMYIFATKVLENQKSINNEVNEMKNLIEKQNELMEKLVKNNK